MGKTKYQEMMTALVLEEHNLFEIAYSKVNLSFQAPIPQIHKSLKTN